MNASDNFPKQKETLKLKDYVENHKRGFKSLKKPNATKHKPNLEDIKDSFENIKLELLYNYITNAFGENDKIKINIEHILSFKKDNNKILNLIKERVDNKKKCRNILIIGAGASHDAYEDILLGKDLIEVFRKDYIDEIKNTKSTKEMYEVLEEEIKDINRFGMDFENFLSLLSNHFVNPKSLRANIVNNLGFRYPPHLFYEIVAHMLKHSFFDAVINFNFEELLDQSIEEELSNQNYKFVLTDGHCVNLDELLVDGRLKTPIYIKPHGTFSHKTTMRFTKRHYLDMPTDIENMLSQLLSGYRGDTYGENQIEMVNLFIVGFNLESIELNKIINKKLPGSSKIFHFGFDFNDYKLDDLRDSKKHYFSDFFVRAEMANQKLSQSYQFIPIKMFKNPKSRNQKAGILSEIFSVLWRNIYADFNEIYSPRSIGRHEIISYLFQHNKANYIKPNDARQQVKPYLITNYDQSVEYFRDRTLVEIALKLIRGNGVIDIVEMLSDDGRVGFYYKKFRKICKDYSPKDKKKHSLFDLLNEFTADTSTSDIYSKNEFLHTYNLFKLTPYDSFNNNNKEKWANKIKLNWNGVEKMINKKYIVDQKRGPFENCIENLFIHFSSKGDKKLFNINLTILYRLLTSKLISTNFKCNLASCYSKSVSNGLYFGSESDYSIAYEIFRLFTKSAGSHYYFIRPDYSNPINYMWESYNRSKLIHTNLSLIYEFMDIFLNREWDTLFCVLEAGEIIPKALKYLNLLKDRDNTYEKLYNDIKNGKKRLLLISSYEAVKQMHYHSLVGTDKASNKSHYFDIASVAKIHKTYISGEEIQDSQIKPIWLENTLEVLFMPFGQHNHHSIIFTNFGSRQISDEINSFSFDIKNFCNGYNPEKTFKITSQGSIYMYRRGFSYSINPIYIGLDTNEKTSEYIRNDFRKLMSLLFTYYIRSIEFYNNSYKGENAGGEKDQKAYPSGWISDRFARTITDLFSSSDTFFEGNSYCRNYKQFILEIFKSSSSNRFEIV